MSLIEAQEVIKDWSDAPPLVFLVEALVNGFAGPVKTIEDSAPSAVLELPPSPGDLADLAYRAGASLPILDRDPGLPKSAPIFDFEELRKKNLARIVANAKRKAS